MQHTSHKEHTSHKQHTSRCCLRGGPGAKGVGAGGLYKYDAAGEGPGAKGVGAGELTTQQARARVGASRQNPSSVSLPLTASPLRSSSVLIATCTMHVCMHVRMYVCMYVCVCACMLASMHACLLPWICLHAHAMHSMHTCNAYRAGPE